MLNLGYRVRARNAAGVSEFSEVRCTTTPLANRPPAAQDDHYTVDQDSARVLLAFLANDSDPDAGDSLRIVEAAANQGTVSISGSQLSYSPHTGFSGEDAIAYAVEDTAGARGTATVTVSPTVDAKPIANTDSASIEMDIQTIILVLSNDTGLEDGPIVVSLIQNPSAGTASVAGDGTIVYQPGSGYVGNDPLSYGVTDSDGNSAVSTVGIQVTCSSCPPQTNLTLSWDPSSGQVYGYRSLLRADTRHSDSADLAMSSGQFNPTAPSKQYDVERDLGLGSGEQGCFRIRAYNVYGVSAFSNSACAQR